jgi:predicted transcriptional regulator
MARSLARGGMAGVQVIGRDAADEVLSPKRRALTEALRGDNAESVRGLARQLNRNKGQVSRDSGGLTKPGS